MMDLVTEEKAARKKEKISNFDLKSIIGIYQWKYKVQESDYFFLSNIFALRGDGQEAKAKDPLSLGGHRVGKLKPQKEKREMLRDQRGELDHINGL